MSNRKFLDENFLLNNEAAVQLYHQYASQMSIIDYHNHLSPKDICENRKFNNLTELWLDGDHYKWRAMRINGISEKYCTGNATPFEKFEAWAKTVPYTLRNPLYHWAHLELKRYFGIEKLLDEPTAKEIYNHCNELLNQDDFRVQSLLSKMKVEVVCTTDDPVDNLEYHQDFASQGASFKMFPSFRPDKSYATHDPEAYNNYLDRLSDKSGITINTFDNLIEALRKRILFFDQLGCRSSDHGLESLYFDATDRASAPALFKKVRENKPLLKVEQLQLQCAVIIELCKLYHEVGWAQQFHLGAMRNNNTRIANTIGADTGFDSIGEYPQAYSMSRFFDHLDSANQLTKTILYNSNPIHNEIFATMAGNFSDGSEPGKIQFGAGWWFLDQKNGMERQLNALSNMGLLSRFIGMVTDSRSFLSFSRHEYFRRVLCNLIGTDVYLGELPNDFNLLGKMVKDICYFNTKAYFRF